MLKTGPTFKGGNRGGGKSMAPMPQQPPMPMQASPMMAPQGIQTGPSQMPAMQPPMQQGGMLQRMMPAQLPLQGGLEGLFGRFNKFRQ